MDRFIGKVDHVTHKYTKAFTFLCVLLFGALADSAEAGINRWTSNGPEGGIVNALAIDPLNPNTVYAGTVGGGVFKSTDGAASWQPKSTGLTNTRVSTLTIDPVNSATIYAGTTDGGVFKSTDGAASWQQVNTGLPENASVAALAIDPVNPTTVYASINGGVFKSTNGGANWEALAAAPGQVRAFAIDPLNPATVYAGAIGGVIKTTDGGATWQVVHSINFAAVSALAIDPVNPATIYAGYAHTITSGGIFKSTDSGATWQPVNDINFAAVYTLAIDPVNPATIYAGTHHGVIKSTNAGANWQAVNTGLGLSNSIAAALAIDPRNPAIVYAVTSSDGVFKSTNGGGSWEAINRGLTNTHIYTLAIDPLNPATVYAGTAGNGVVKSTDGGTSWEALNIGPSNFRTIYQALVIDPLNPATIYVVFRAESSSTVFKSTDGGANWQQAGLGGFLIFIQTLAIDPLNPATIYAGTGGSGIFKSTDGGANWQTANTGLSFPNNFNIAALVIDPLNPATVYAALNGSGVFKTTDGGANWQAANVGLPNNPSITALAIDPVHPTTVYVSTDGGGVFKTTDGGATWQSFNIGLPNNTFVQALAIDPLNPDTVYAGTNGNSVGNGVFKSTDGGANWQSFNAGLPNNTFVQALAIDSLNPATVYAGTLGGGVFTITFGAPPPPPQPVLSVTPTSLDFGAVSIGSSADLEFTAQNTGQGTLSGTASTSVPFSIVSGGSFSLAAGASQAVGVRFGPTVAGSFGDNVTFTSNGGNASQVVTGTGVATPAISVTPTALNFGTVAVGSSADRTFAVQNIGGGTLSGTCNTAAPFSLPSGCSFNIASGQTADVTVRFSPTATGSFTGNVSVTSNAGDASLAVTGTGTVKPPLTIRSISPTSGTVGTIVTIKGKNFGATKGSSFISFASARAAIDSWSDTQLVARVPLSSPGTLSVTVNTGAGTSNSVPFTYVNPVIFNVERPPLLERQDFVRLGRFNPQLELEFLAVAENERDAGIIDGSNGVPGDDCYLGAVDAVARQQAKRFVEISIRKLATDIFSASVGAITTGSRIGDYLLKFSAEMVNSAVLNVPLDETLLVFVTEKTAGFVAGNATKSFILGETASLLTKSTIAKLLDEDDAITWELRGNNLGTGAQRTGLAPLTNISAELFYNPYTHYTTALIGATCNLQGSTKKAIYIQRYEVAKTAFGSAEMVDGTLTVAVRQLQ